MSKLKTKLRFQGRSQTWLADQLGVTTNTVNNWCNGAKIPQSQKIAIATVLEINKEEL